MEEIRHVSKNDDFIEWSEIELFLKEFRGKGGNFKYSHVLWSTLHAYKHCARDNPREDYIANFCKVNVIARYSTSNTTLNFYNFTENGLIPELKKKKKKKYHQGSKNKYHELETGAKKNFRSKVDRKHQPVCFPYIVQFVKRNLSSSYSWL